jgi:stress response protein SCP2
MVTATGLLLRRANKLFVPHSGGDTLLAPGILAAFNVNLQSLGYTLSLEAAERLKTLSPEQASDLYHQAVDVLCELRGCRTYRPMYPNFPEQVMAASEAELYWNAVLHYWSVYVADHPGVTGVVWLPHYEKKQRRSLDDKVEYTPLGIGTEEDLTSIAQKLASANASLSPADKDDLVWLIFNNYLKTFPQIPNKENLAVIGATLIGTPQFASIAPLYKNATDVLRLAVALQGGDVSLAKPTRFAKMSRTRRKTILELLENCANREEDMLRWSERWKRLGECIHPGEFSKRFHGSNRAFIDLRNGEVKTFNAKVEITLEAGAWTEATKLLTLRPGDFARRLDHVMRMSSMPLVVAYLFGGIVTQVSTPVLLQVHAHFKHRSTSDIRVFFPKGSLAKVAAVPNKLPTISAAARKQVVNLVERTLINRFAELPPLGATYLDPNLQNYLVPFSQRSASASLRTLVRGSKVRLPEEGNTVRFFMWWKEGETRCDLDLSAMMFDSNWEYKENISYFKLRSSGGSIRACHSGDITSAPNGACEFIDVDMESFANAGGRYIVMSVNSFTHQKFSNLPEALAGWMIRQHVNSGEIFEPSTVQDRVTVTLDGTAVLPLAIDVQERRVIWFDMPYSATRRLPNNVASHEGTITLIGRAFTELRKPTLYDLLYLHIQGRGRWVGTESEADTIFSEKSGIQFQIADIMSQYMIDRAPASSVAPVASLVEANSY